MLVGGREPVRVQIADYDPEWATKFMTERDRIAGALGELPIRIEHIGSTSVPMLAAKPIVDVLVTLPDPEAEDAFVPHLGAVGFVLRVREPGHRMLRNAARDVHVHVWADQDPEVERYLRFRDQLRRSVTDRVSYEQLKRALAEQEWADMNHYAQAKGRLIEDILARARHSKRC